MPKAAKTTEPAEAPAGHIQSLEKGLRILDEIIAAPAPVKLADIIKKFDMDKASAFRFLQTLEFHGFLRKDSDTKEYDAGGRLYYWASRLRQKTRIIDAFHGHLERLANMTQHTAHLGLLVNDRVLLADFAHSSSIVAIHHAIGGLEPIHSSAAGKAIVAFLPREKRDEMIEANEFIRFTERTIMTREELILDLEMVRERGYAVDAGESYGGLYCVARPVMDSQGQPFASLGITTVTALVGRDSDHFRTIIGALETVATEISRELKG